MQVAVLFLLISLSVGEVWPYSFRKGEKFTLPLTNTDGDKIKSLQEEQDKIKGELKNVVGLVENLKNKIETQQAGITTDDSGQGGKRSKSILSELSSKHELLRKDHDQLTQRVNDLLGCGPPPDVANATVTHGDGLVGSEATYSCQPDFRQCGDNMKITCLSNKSWEKPSVRCDRFRWINPDVNFFVPLTCGEQSSLTVVIKGTPTKETVMRFTLRNKSDYLFNTDVRFDDRGMKKKINFNAYINRRWIHIKATSKFPFWLMKTFTHEITLEDGKYQVKVDGEVIGTFKEKLKGARPDSLLITKDLTLQKVEILP